MFGGAEVDSMHRPQQCGRGTASGLAWQGLVRPPGVTHRENGLEGPRSLGGLLHVGAI